MASKRMFDKAIIEQDGFFDLPMEAKALYFLLGMEADDEGFINPRKVLRLYGGNDDSIRILSVKGFIIPFDTGVIVITDWKRNNYIDKKRVKPTIYQQEKAQITYDEVSEKYVFNKCLTNVQQMLKENSIDKNSIDILVEQSSPVCVSENSNSLKKTKKKYGVYKRVLLTDDEYNRLTKEFGKEFIERQISKLDEYIESNNNKNKYSNFNLVLRKAIREKWFKEEQLPNWFDKKIEVEEPSEETLAAFDEMEELLKGIGE